MQDWPGTAKSISPKPRRPERRARPALSLWQRGRGKGRIAALDGERGGEEGESLFAIDAAGSAMLTEALAGSRMREKLNWRAIKLFDIPRFRHRKIAVSTKKIYLSKAMSH